MLDQLVRWTEIAGTVIDVALLARILSLRLHRTFQFVTLYCTVVVLLDAVGWLLGIGSDDTQRVFVYSRFLMIVIFPLAAWDAFEGVPAPLQVFRRPQLVRLITGMVLTTVVALLVGGTMGENATSYDVTIQVAIIVWLSSSASSLGFVWIMRRLARAQKVALSGNIETFSTYFLLVFTLEVLAAISVVIPMKGAAQLIEIALTLAGAAISAWCIARLRPEGHLAEQSRAL